MSWLQTFTIATAIVVTGVTGIFMIRETIGKEARYLAIATVPTSGFRCTVEPEVSADVQRILTLSGEVETIAGATELTIRCSQE